MHGNFGRWSCQLILSVLTLVCAIGSSVQAQVPERMVIGTGVVCRDEPKTSAKAVHVYQLGDLIAASNESTDGSGVWYFDEWHVTGQSPTCWIFGPLTTSFTSSNPVPALLAAVDHVLGRPLGEVPFEDYVAVENLLLSPRYSDVTESSGILQFRKLTLVDRAVSIPGAWTTALAKDPLKQSWVLSHQNELSLFESAARWVVQPPQYWALFEHYKQETWAEEVAWAAANAVIPGDECDAFCILSTIQAKFLQYWIRFPTGPHVSKALELAANGAKYAVDVACVSQGPDDSVPRELLAEYRNSLREVTAAEKAPLLDDLNQIEAKCYPSKP